MTVLLNLPEFSPPLVFLQKLGKHILQISKQRILIFIKNLKSEEPFINHVLLTRNLIVFEKENTNTHVAIAISFFMIF